MISVCSDLIGIDQTQSFVRVSFRPAHDVQPANNLPLAPVNPANGQTLLTGIALTTQGTSTTERVNISNGAAFGLPQATYATQWLFAAMPFQGGQPQNTSLHFEFTIEIAIFAGNSWTYLQGRSGDAGRLLARLRLRPSRLRLARSQASSEAAATFFGHISGRPFSATARWNRLRPSKSLSRRSSSCAGRAASTAPARPWSTARCAILTSSSSLDASAGPGTCRRRASCQGDRVVYIAPNTHTHLEAYLRRPSCSGRSWSR